MTAQTLTYSWDGCLQTPCPSWCNSPTCDGTVHGSEPVDISVKCHPHPVTLSIVQFANQAQPRISLTDAHGRREDELDADEAEQLANRLLDHAKILRANAREVSR